MLEYQLTQIYDTVHSLLFHEGTLNWKTFGENISGANQIVVGYKRINIDCKVCEFSCLTKSPKIPYDLISSTERYLKSQQCCLTV